MAREIGCPLFLVDEFPASELNRWALIFEVEYYIKHPEKMPKETPETVTLEDSQDQLMALLGVNPKEVAS